MAKRKGHNWSRKKSHKKTAKIQRKKSNKKIVDLMHLCRKCHVHLIRLSPEEMRNLLNPSHVVKMDQSEMNQSEMDQSEMDQLSQATTASHLSPTTSDFELFEQPPLEQVASNDQTGADALSDDRTTESIGVEIDASILEAIGPSAQLQKSEREPELIENEESVNNQIDSGDDENVQVGCKVVAKLLQSCCNFNKNFF